MLLEKGIPVLYKEVTRLYLVIRFFVLEGGIRKLQSLAYYQNILQSVLIVVWIDSVLFHRVLTSRISFFLGRLRKLQLLWNFSLFLVEDLIWRIPRRKELKGSSELNSISAMSAPSSLGASIWNPTLSSVWTAKLMTCAMQAELMSGSNI